MQLASIRGNGGQAAAVARLSEGPFLPTGELLGKGPEGGDLFDHLCRDEIGALRAALERGTPSGKAVTDLFDAPYRRPRKILGIGLNYRAHALDARVFLERHGQQALSRFLLRGLPGHLAPW